MANTQMGPPDVGFVNSLKAVPDMGGSDSDLTTPVNYTSITALRARLTAIDATYYTSAKLDEMTVNDMVYAVRLADDETTFSDYQES